MKSMTEVICEEEDKRVFDCLRHYNKFLYIKFAKDKTAAFSKIAEYDDDKITNSDIVIDLSDYKVIKNRSGSVQKAFVQ